MASKSKTVKTFYQFNPYLDEWKKELDDGALNQKVLNHLCSLPKVSRILDVGTGSGVQIRRNIELGLLKNHGEIIGVDVNSEGLRNSIISFQHWVRKKGYSLKRVQSPAIHTFNIGKGKEHYTIHLFAKSVYDLKQSDFGRFKMVTALSVFEHTITPQCLHALRNVMEPKALIYAPSNYDQHTIFGPTKETGMWAEISLMNLFNYTAIDHQLKGGVEFGNSRSGSTLPSLFSQNNLKALAYGSSDWVIPPSKAVPYTLNKKKVLRFFVNAFYQTFKSAKPQIKKMFHVNDLIIKQWYQLRMRQLSTGELYFSCMQKDILGRMK